MEKEGRGRERKKGKEEKREERLNSCATGT